VEASSAGKHGYKGQREMNLVLGMFGLLDFNILRPVVAWRGFDNYEAFISLIFQFFPRPP
jgi:hypothetical protein